MSKNLDVSEILRRLDAMSSDIDSSDDIVADGEVILENGYAGALHAIVKSYHDLLEKQDNEKCSVTDDSIGADPDYQPDESTTETEDVRADPDYQPDESTTET